MDTTGWIVTGWIVLVIVLIGVVFLFNRPRKKPTQSNTAQTKPRPPEGSGARQPQSQPRPPGQSGSTQRRP